MENTNTTEARLARAEARIEQLEKTVRELMQGTQGTTLTAPVRVVSEQGTLIAELTQETRRDGTYAGAVLRLFDRQGNVGASLGTDGDGGFLTIRNKNNVMVAYLNVEMSGARFWVADNDAFNGNEGGSGVVLFGGGDFGGGIHINRNANFNPDFPAIALWAAKNGGDIEIFPADVDDRSVVLTAAGETD